MPRQAKNLGINVNKVAQRGGAGIPNYRPSYFRKYLQDVSASKIFKFGARNPILSGGLLALGATAMHTAGGLFRTFDRPPIEKPRSLTLGPGFINWSKTSGMPANHLSTDGLALALSKTRHVSLI